MVASTPSTRLTQVQDFLKPKESLGESGARNVYIISAARTPTGKFNGGLKTLTGPQLGAVAIKAAVHKANIPVEKITDVYMGNVLQANEGQSPARQAMTYADLPSSVEAVTVNKVCASGLKAVMLAAQNIQLGLADAQVAGGFESMSNVPYYSPRASQSKAFGHMSLEDGLIKDGLWDPYNQIHMGTCAEHSAKQFQIPRQEQDKYAIRSYKRAQQSWSEGRFNHEIAPVTVKDPKGETVVEEDEGWKELVEAKVPVLKPVFMKDGTITAANSSTMNDGASAVVLVSSDLVAQYGANSRALCRIVSYADAAVDPIDFSCAPAKALAKALQRGGLRKQDITLWEVNEAFAAVIGVTERILGLENAKVNIFGGAIALGHALGSSGCRILTTLIHQLEVGQYGAVGICNGGGGSSAMIVQRVNSV
ncbi:uncharacterized protein PV06_05301 [Exophiala oligosperma]|uniref:acetyl-CoA C-acetyltransferase n=1 Tax=Exophiala oligosperma TaxID=215243 RepID=A0A0D2AWV6_9EURO|nr:uncharacterized protein PV06_05301 [Exophiala oligosperma]KIW44281.1 hypothetical protein PV06_05301 [Exophiala oligosperma]